MTVRSELAEKVDLPKPWIPVDYVLTKTSNGVDWCEQKGGGGGGSLGPIAYIKDDAGNKYFVKAEVNPAGQIVASIEQNPTNFVPMTVEQEKNRALLAEGILEDQITNEVARAQLVEEDLDERIKSMSAVGRFLSTWDCTAGKPGTEPKTSPMAYKAGDYYIVASVETGSITNYIPSGTVYTNGSVSTAFTTNAVSVNDLFRHTDDGGWVHVSMSGVSTTFGQIAGEPRDNMKLANELDKAGPIVNFDITKAGDEYISSISASTISNLIANGKTPVARFTFEDGAVVRLPFGMTDDTMSYFTFQQNIFVGVESADEEVVAAVYDDGGVTKVQFESVSAVRGTVKRITLNGDLYQPNANGSVTITNVASESSLIAETNRAQIAEKNIEAFVVAETNRAQIAETNIEAFVVAETNRAQTAEAAITNMIVQATNNVNVIRWWFDSTEHYEIFADGRISITYMSPWTPSHSPIPSSPAEGDVYYENPVFSGGQWRVGHLEYHMSMWIPSGSVPLAGATDPDATTLTFPDGTPTTRQIVTETSTLVETNLLYEVESNLNARIDINHAMATNLDARLVAETNRSIRIDRELAETIVNATNKLDVITKHTPGNTERVFANRDYEHVYYTEWNPATTPVDPSPSEGARSYGSVTLFGQLWVCNVYVYTSGSWHYYAMTSMTGGVGENVTSLTFPDGTPTTRTRIEFKSQLALTNDVYDIWTNLDTRVVAETNRSYVADTNLDARLVAEMNRSYTVDTNLEERVISETNRAQMAEHNLGDRIDDEDARAQLAEQTLSDRIVAETNRSIQADNYIIGIATNKQNKLPNPINGKFLHANEVSGNLEWADAGGITSGFVEEGGKKLQIDPPAGYDTRDLLRADNYSKGYQVGHYKATLTALESPTGSAVLGYYKVTDLGDGDAFIEAVMKNGLVYFCSRQGGTWSSWTCPSKQTALDVAHPVNSIWIQYTNDDAPSTLFNGNGISSTWTDVTANYASRFFKADPYLAVGTLETESLPKPSIATAGAHAHAPGTLDVVSSWFGVARKNAIYDRTRAGAFTFTKGGDGSATYQDTELDGKNSSYVYNINMKLAGNWNTATATASSGGHTHTVNTSGPYGDNYSVKPLTSTVKIWKRTN